MPSLSTLLVDELLKAHTDAAANDIDNDNDSSFWQSTGPHVGDALVRTVLTTTTTTGAGAYNNKLTQGQVVAYAAANPDLRRPELFLWKSHQCMQEEHDDTNNNNNNIQILTSSDVVENNNKKTRDTTAPTPSPYLQQQLVPTVISHTLQERLELVVEQRALELLPNLVLLACLEEIWSHYMQQQSQQYQGNSSTAQAQAQVTHQRPSYYTTTQVMQQQQYHHHGASSDDDAAASAYSSVTTSPTQIASRCKAGCVLAYNYHVEQQRLEQQQLLLLSAESNIRRSTRLPTAAPPSKPNVLQRGGRIALYLLEQQWNNNNKNKVKEEAIPVAEPQESVLVEPQPQQAPIIAEEEQATVDPQAPAETANNNSNNNNAAAAPQHDSDANDDGSLMNALDEPVTESEDDDNDDEEFDVNEIAEEEEEEEELENVARESSRVLELSGDEHDNDNDNSSDDDNDDDDNGREYDIYSNPFLAPTLVSLLDWMGRRAKSTSAAEIQTAMITCLKKKHTQPHLSFNDNHGSLLLLDLDQLVVVPGTTRLVLELVASGEQQQQSSWKELSKLDAAQFSKTCRVRLASNVEAELQWATQVEAEERYRAAKTWSLWRYKGIHGGYTVWPSWMDAVQAHAEFAQQQQEESQEAAAAVVEEPPAADTTSADEALAQQLAAAESSSTITGASRRSRRAKSSAAEGGGGVYYGGQSQMSPKVLMETLVRLCKQSSYSTMPALETKVAEDTTNPLYRLRVALGRLIYKRNQLSRCSVNNLWSDEALWNMMQSEGPLVQRVIVAKIKPEAAAAAAAAMEAEPEEDPRLEALVAYLQGLHQTELQLRSMILAYMTKLPITTVAMAADELPGSKEALDAAAFEDPSKLEWSSATTTGQPLIGQLLFRPAVVAKQHTAENVPECRWYKVQDCCESVLYQQEAPPVEDDRVVLVERRTRYRVVPVTEDGELDEGLQPLILTQGQVHAGLKAAAMHLEEKKVTSSMDEHPFAGGAGTKVTLTPFVGYEEQAKVLNCIIVGHNSFVESENKRVHQILLLPEKDPSAVAFWAALSADEDGNFACHSFDESWEPSTVYKLEQSDYDHGSPAFEACRGIVDYLTKHPKCQIFLQPVDPVALNIPDYFNIIKHPMDISTLSKRLEKGHYSKIVPGKTVGRTAVARMLNGPFKEDAVRMFDNAILFNPPGDWIHNTAVSLKKALLKKIDQACSDADTSDGFEGRGAARGQRSVYIEYDSDDFDYGSDAKDEDYTNGGVPTKKRKRRSGSGRDDFSTHAMEAPIRLQTTCSETLGLRSPFSNLPIVSESSAFSLSSDWSCRRSMAKKVAAKEEPVEEDPATRKRREEIAELLALQRQVQENEQAHLRRSTRAHYPTMDHHHHHLNSGAANKLTLTDLEYFTGVELPPLDDTTGSSESTLTTASTATSRQEVESILEVLHEEYYCKLYQKSWRTLQSADGNCMYTNASFPPYLGRVVPAGSSLQDSEHCTWEIRSNYVVPAIRWVLRGLVASGHLAAVEPMGTEAPLTSGIVLPNNIYYYDGSATPFDILEPPKKKRAAHEEPSSEEEFEMSDYEKLRAERVARNQERLKALGLA